MNSNTSIELLAPCGSKDVLNAAIGEGADAVYLGLSSFNARQRAQNFSYKQYEALTEKLHDLNKKVYVTLNTVFEARETDMVYNLLKYLNYIKPDAVIVQDLGLIKMINSLYPEIKIHASTQMNIASLKGVNYLSKNGVSRVVLARELSFEQIKEIRNNTNAELEIFVHGALCISASGLCLFSSYLGGKSANRGWCTQACRRYYDADTKSGYFFSPRDLMLLEYLPDLKKIGINSIKIEGRMKSAEYTACVVSAYRYVIDHCDEDRDKAIAHGLKILQNDYARSKTAYFFINPKNTDFINPAETGGTGIPLGKIKQIILQNNQRLALIPADHPLAVKDQVRLHKADDSDRILIKINIIEQHPNGILIPVPAPFDAGDDAYLVNIKKNQQKYPHIIPKSLDHYKRHPGKEQCPFKTFTHSTPVQNKLPAGIYVKISNIKDIFLVQSISPVKLIIHYNRQNASELTKTLKSVNFKPEDMILYLDPYFTDRDDQWLNEALPNIRCNYPYIIINNPGQISLCRDKNTTLIAGPYLYSYNSMAIEFLNQAGIGYWINPYENSKENLFKTTLPFDRTRCLITLFNFPELFQIQNDLAGRYEFSTIIDKLNNQFHLISLKDQAVIIPDKPFSITDKIPELSKAGFNKFIIDFSYINLKKNYCKSIMQYIQNNQPISGTSRFNWKNGFYRGDK